MSEKLFREPRPNYPRARRAEIIDAYHGVEVADPYRWLEQPGAERAAWITAERELFASYAPNIAAMDHFKDRIESYYPAVTDDTPFQRGKRTFFYRIGKDDNYWQLYERDPQGERLLVDPNTWSDDGSVSPAGINVSPLGRYVSVKYSENGNDRQKWRLVDVETGEDTADTFAETKNAHPSWRRDETGFYYVRLLSDGRRPIYFHRVGTRQEADTTLFMPEPGDNDWYYQRLSDDNQWLYIYSYPDDGPQSIGAIDLMGDAQTVTPLVTHDRESVYSFIFDNDDTSFLAQTTDGAEKGRIVRFEKGGDWTDVISESDDALTAAETVTDKIIASYYTGTRSYVKVFSRAGELLDTITPPGDVGSVSFSIQEFDNPLCYMTIESPVQPPTTFTYDVSKGELKHYKDSEYKLETDCLDVTLEYATSKDGTRIPLFICAHKDIPRDGANPTILYGYGGFGISMEPTFNLGIMPWLEAGGVYVTACLRGGDEYGNAWHEVAKKLGKQNVFDDFIASTEHLFEAGLTSPEHLAIEGGSNGGLLVGAVLTQRPDLMRVALPHAGVLDMIRYDKDEYAAAGRGWRSEYGSTDDPEQFANLLAYSPLHNVEPRAYPIVYASVGEADDRVLPEHTYKFIAALQAAQRGPDPIIVDIEPVSGHQLSGRERSDRRNAHKYAFLLKQLA